MFKIFLEPKFHLAKNLSLNTSVHCFSLKKNQKNKRTSKPWLLKPVHTSPMQSEDCLHYAHELETMILRCVSIKLIHKVNEIPMKTKSDPFEGKHTLILKFIWKFKGLRIAKTILNKKKNVGGLSLPDLTLNYKTTVHKTMWYHLKGN